MLDKLPTIAGAIATILSPVLAFALRGSRRNRLLGRIDTYIRLADQLQDRDAESAARVRRLAADTVQLLVHFETRSIRRRLDPWAFVTILLLSVPGAVGIGVAVSHDRWWRWVVIGPSALWIFIIVVAGLANMWETRDELLHDLEDGPTETKAQ